MHVLPANRRRLSRAVPLGPQHGELHRDAVAAARHAVLAMRASHEIGDDAFHQVEEELDWLEMASGRSPS